MNGWKLFSGQNLSEIFRSILLFWLKRDGKLSCPISPVADQIECDDQIRGLSESFSPLLRSSLGVNSIAASIK